MKPVLATVLLVGAAAITPARGDCVGVHPVGNTTLRTVAVVTGLTGRPLFVTSPPADTNRLFILEQNGFIRIKKRGDPPATVSTFLDISAKVQAAPSNNEMGLLGMAFDPDYATNGFFYLNYTEGPILGPWFTVVARYSVTPGSPDLGDPDSEVRLLRFSQPENNHKGGQLQFGPDGMLYVSTGDGGGGGDAHGTCGNGQELSALLGKMLRIDVRGIDPASVAPDCGGATAGYRVPSGNPFADGLGGLCDEVWSYGLRNPWRSSFDAATGDLYVADVGQNCWEEINYTPAGVGGKNYAWRMMEGTHCFNPSTPSTCNPTPATCGTVPPCNDPSYARPILDYGHTAGACSVTGGYVYRGCQMPNYSGIYFYGDYCAGFIRGLRVSGGVATNLQDYTSQLDPGASLLFSLTSFSVDVQGEIYITDRDGIVLRIVPPFPSLEVSGDGAAADFRLSQAAWVWENLQFTTMNPVASYRVYRGAPAGGFRCVLATSATQWVGGDPALPAPGAMFAYLVTAISPTGEQTATGSPSATLLPDPCP
ncbi:MAG TPA: PQQ-dependent sugar dehydrogenase [Patescibacteria group bacterium]|nr:PQQ-dependent sugar dehydrogenase [Patescibacteria group bacterium]